MSTNNQGGANALATRPTVEQEMSKFKGFTTNNGETVDGETTRKGPAERNLSPEEEAAGVTIAGADKAGEKTTKVELTDEEKTAALDKSRTALGLKDDEELTPEEETEALAAALKEKTNSTGKGPTHKSRAVRRANGLVRAATRRAEEAETKYRTLEQRLAALEGRGTLTADGKPAKADDDKEPDPSKFELGELDPKYIRALARWEVRQEMALSSQTKQAQQQKSQQDQAAVEIAEKRAAFEEVGFERFDDFQEVVLDTVGLPKSDPAAWPLSATIGALMFNSEFGADVAYALASDPKEAKRVDKLSDAEKQRWFFRQEAKFEAEKTSAAASGEKEQDDTGRTSTPKPAQRTATNAPPPPRKRSNGAGSTSGVSADTQDFAAFEAMHRQTARARH